MVQCVVCERPLPLASYSHLAAVMVVAASYEMISDDDSCVVIKTKEREKTPLHLSNKTFKNLTKIGGFINKTLNPITFENKIRFFHH